MNIFRLSALSLLTILIMPIGANAHCGDNHTGNHPHCANEPPPPPPVESCVDASGVFPSFAYTTKIYGGKRGSWSATNLHLANSDGTCSIIIYTQESREDLDPSYRQFGTDGRIVWDQESLGNLGRKDPAGGRPVLKMLDFTIVDGELVAVSEPATVYMDPPRDSGVGIDGTELSPDGNSIYFRIEYWSEIDGWVDVLYSVDVSICTSLCPSDVVIAANPDNIIFGLDMNASGQRLYIGGSGSGIRFIEVTPTGYSSVRTVASRSDLGDLKVHDISVGNWDWDSDVNGTKNEVVAVTLDNVNTVYVLDVSKCNISALPSPATCLASGDSSIILSGPDGYSTSFQNEDLLIDYGDNVQLLDTDTLTSTVLLQGYRPDSIE